MVDLHLKQHVETEHEAYYTMTQFSHFSCAQVDVAGDNPQPQRAGRVAEALSFLLAALLSEGELMASLHVSGSSFLALTCCMDVEPTLRSGVSPPFPSVSNLGYNLCKDHERISKARH
ncbi:hypothetical protein INR49_014382 [Caranx melampygus]|nr:hypothetical protein INR49_014382 [Caranx melampygus]